MSSRVDMRIVIMIEEIVHNVSTAKFANESLGPGKFSNDHRKLLCKSKGILDGIVNSKYISILEARKLAILIFQASGLDG